MIFFYILVIKKKFINSLLRKTYLRKHFTSTKVGNGKYVTLLHQNIYFKAFLGKTCNYLLNYYTFPCTQCLSKINRIKKRNLRNTETLPYLPHLIFSCRIFYQPFERKSWKRVFVGFPFFNRFKSILVQYRFSYFVCFIHFSCNPSPSKMHIQTRFMCVTSYLYMKKKSFML